MSLRMRSSAWLFFDKTSDPSTAKCSLCGTSIKSYSSTTNLLKHLRSRHFEETSGEIHWDNAGTDSVEQSVDDMSAAELSKDSSTIVQEAADEYDGTEYAEYKGCLEQSDQGGEVSTDVAAFFPSENDDLAAVVAEVAMNHLIGQTDRRKSTRSLAWACFTRIADSDVAVCKFCRMVVKTESGSTSNMLNHFVRRHSKEYEEAKAKRQSGLEELAELHTGEADEDIVDPDGGSSQDGASAELLASALTERTNKSIVWACFAKLSESSDSGFHECIHCGAHLRSEQGSTSSMLTHFMKKHPDEYRAAISSRSAKSDTKSSLIRKHFNQLTNDDWSCCFCQRLLRQPGSSVSNLIKHLMKKHVEEYKIIFSESRTPSKSFSVKTELVEDDFEEADDDQSNGITCESQDFTEQPHKRQKLSSPNSKNASESPASKMATIWRRHCQERHKEHDRQMAVMKEKLSTLQDSMRKVKEEISWVQGEISRSEDAWRKELTRQKEVNRQFQNALKQAESGQSGGSIMANSSSGTTAAGTLAMHVDDSDWM